MTANEPAGSGSWTASLRGRLVRTLPPEKALPDEQPEYVSSWIYVFGVATLAALIVVVLSGDGAVGVDREQHARGIGHLAEQRLGERRILVRLLVLGVLPGVGGDDERHRQPAWRGRPTSRWWRAKMISWRSAPSIFTAKAS